MAPEYVLELLFASGSRRWRYEVPHRRGEYHVRLCAVSAELVEELDVLVGDAADAVVCDSVEVYDAREKALTSVSIGVAIQLVMSEFTFKPMTNREQGETHVTARYVPIISRMSISLT